MGSILQTYSWRLDLDGKDPESVMSTIRAMAATLVRVRPVLRGCKLEMLPTGRLHISLRVAGHTRWEIQRDARRLIIGFLRKAFIPTRNIELELVTTERNGRELYLGEGRTPMTKRPRSVSGAPGAHWRDEYEWWGDELPTDPDSSTVESADPTSPDPEPRRSDSASPATGEPVREVWSSLE